LDDRCAQWLAERAHLVRRAQDEPGFEQALEQARGLIVRTYTQVDQRLLEAAPRLKVVGRSGVGLDNIDLPACRERGVRVVYTPEANTQAVVEYVTGLILDAIRPRDSLGAPVESSVFHGLRKTQVGRQASELTLGILGFGRIGKRLARAAVGLGMAPPLVHDLLPEAELRAATDVPFSFVDRATLLSRSDILSLHVDGRPENRAIIDATALAQLRPSCLLINAARGMLVDAHALAQWARRVEPAGGAAALDVHAPEPPGPDYPLWGLPNVRLLPHLAARTHTALQNMSWVVRDVYRVLIDQAPEFPARG
jgi:phosphoglycerate dehydrogenase-like enzyme